MGLPGSVQVDPNFQSLAEWNLGCKMVQISPQWNAFLHALITDVYWCGMCFSQFFSTNSGILHLTAVPLDRFLWSFGTPTWRAPNCDSDVSWCHRRADRRRACYDLCKMQMMTILMMQIWMRAVVVVVVVVAVVLVIDVVPMSRALRRLRRLKGTSLRCAKRVIRWLGSSNMWEYTMWWVLRFCGMHMMHHFSIPRKPITPAPGCDGSEAGSAPV